jgi:hypothetical protein
MCICLTSNSGFGAHLLLYYKKIKQIFVYIPSAATVIPEIGKAIDTIKAECYNNTMRLIWQA